MKSTTSTFKLQPIYFLAGEDLYAIDEAITEIRNLENLKDLSEMDVEVFNSKNANLSEIIDSADEISFLTSNRLIIIKEFNKVFSQLKRKKNDLREKFIRYIQNPSSFTYMIFVFPEKLPKDDKTTKELFDLLKQKNYLFEFNHLKGDALKKWIQDEFTKYNKFVDIDIASTIVELAGEERFNLKNEIDKIINYCTDKEKIELKDIIKIVAAGKEYSIFDLQKAISDKNAAKAMEISRHLIQFGTEPLVIITMLNKYFLTLLYLMELKNVEKDNTQLARKLEIHPYFLPEYLKALNNFNFDKLKQIFNFLLEADKGIKTSTMDKSTAITMLLAIIFEN